MLWDSVPLFSRHFKRASRAKFKVKRL